MWECVPLGGTLCHLLVSPTFSARTFTRLPTRALSRREPWGHGPPDPEPCEGDNHKAQGVGPGRAATKTPSPVRAKSQSPGRKPWESSRQDPEPCKGEINPTSAPRPA